MTSTLASKFDQEMACVYVDTPLPAKIAVAVSGGSDSMALCLLAGTWCAERNVEILALTVDHGLRAEAADEAVLVGQWLLSRNIDHQVLTRTGPAPQTGIQQFARNARYKLLLDKCNEVGATSLLIGHQLEDQLETFLMRVSKGSALQGLSVMRAKGSREGIDLGRPLLGIHRAHLREYLRNEEQDWIEDPSNESVLYTRTELGRVLQSMVSLPGSSSTAIELSVNRLQRADDALGQITDVMLDDKAHTDPLGYVQFPQSFFENVPAEINVRFLMSIFKTVRGKSDPIKLIHIEQLLGRLTRGEVRTPLTLAGCQLRPSKESWILCREPGRSALPKTPLKGGREMTWDNRFVVMDHGSDLEREAAIEFDVSPLGDDGWSQVTESALPDYIKKLPSMVRKNLPAIWNNGEIVDMPLFLGQKVSMGIAKGRFEMVFIPTIKREKQGL